MSAIDLVGKVRIHHDPATGEAGLQVRMVNKTGAASVKGYVVSPDGTTPTDRGFVYTAVDVPDPIGIVAEAGVADGSECWVWQSGIAEIYVTASATVRQFARVTATGDSDTTAGRLTNEAAPSSPFATDKHFQEVGHVIKARTGAGLTLAVIHFN